MKHRKIVKSNGRCCRRRCRLSSLSYRRPRRDLLFHSGLVSCRQVRGAAPAFCWFRGRGLEQRVRQIGLKSLAPCKRRTLPKRTWSQLAAASAELQSPRDRAERAQKSRVPPGVQEEMRDREPRSPRRCRCRGEYTSPQPSGDGRRCSRLIPFLQIFPDAAVFLPAPSGVSSW